MPLERAHLELLQALRHHSTLRAAATSINLSPSAASRRLDEAERRVGVALTHVEGRSLELTNAGRYLADAARTADQVLADAAVAARWLGRSAARPIRLGLGFHDTISWAIGSNAAVEFLRTSEHTWPGALTDGTLDLVIDAGEVEPALTRRTIADDRLVAVAATGHPLVAGCAVVDGPDLAELTYFASAVEPRPGFEFEQLFRPSGSSPTKIVKVESASVVLDLVAAGRGVSIQPRLATVHRTDIAVIELVRDIPVRWHAHLGTRADDETDAVVDHFASAATAALAGTTASVPR